MTRIVLDLDAIEITALVRGAEEHRRHCSIRGELIASSVAHELECKIRQSIDDALRGERIREPREETRMN